jgi:hypothetical protein
MLIITILLEEGLGGAVATILHPILYGPLNAREEAVEVGLGARIISTGMPGSRLAAEEVVAGSSKRVVQGGLVWSLC